MIRLPIFILFKYPINKLSFCFVIWGFQHVRERRVVGIPLGRYGPISLQHTLALLSISWCWRFFPLYGQCPSLLEVVSVSVGSVEDTHKLNLQIAQLVNVFW